MGGKAIMALVVACGLLAAGALAQPASLGPPVASPAQTPSSLPIDVPGNFPQQDREHFVYDGQLPPEQAPPPKKTPQPPKDYGPFKIVEPTEQNTIELIVGLPKIMVFDKAPKRVQMDEDEKGGVAAFKVITEKELSIVGKRPGRTVLNLWFDDPKKPLVSYLVNVSPDPQAQLHIRAQLDRYYQVLEREINCAFPDSHVCLRIVGNKLLVSGQARDVAEATQILQIISTRATQQGAGRTTQGLTQIVEHGLAQSTVTKVPDENPEDVSEFSTNPYFRGGLQVINLLRVPGEQQVMLRVVVAEIDRTAARNFGLNYSITNDQGIKVLSNLTGVGSGTGGGSAGAINSTGGGTQSAGVNLPFFLDGGQVAVQLTALKNHNLARTLAEPTLVTMNGQRASFRAGGEFPVPVVTGFTAAGLSGVSFVPFGVQVQFTPVVTDKDRVRLIVNADVSTRDLQSSATVNGTNVPGLNSRTFQTTVEMREGQTMAVAGLIQKNYAANSARVPFLGNIPVVGRLFGGQDSTSAGEQELVILVTPVLQHALDPHNTRPLPGSDLLEPNDTEFYWLGRLESHQFVDYRSPVRTDLQRMEQYHQENRPYPGVPEGYPAQPTWQPSPGHEPIPPGAPYGPHGSRASVPAQPVIERPLLQPR